jgi:hypothetical protein
VTGGLFVGLLIAVQISVVIAFFWMVFNIAAIRRMLENQGLFSGVPCRWCRMPVPTGADVCGHCGRDLAPPGPP